LSALIGNIWRLYSKEHLLELDVELTLLFSYRTTKIVEFLKELKNSGCLNTMHILLVYLQQAHLVQHPLAAAMLLQLDLLVTPPKDELFLTLTRHAFQYLYDPHTTFSCREILCSTVYTERKQLRL
jgi:hypothetical protein